MPQLNPPPDSSPGGQHVRTLIARGWKLENQRSAGRNRYWGLRVPNTTFRLYITPTGTLRLGTTWRRSSTTHPCLPVLLQALLAELALQHRQHSTPQH